MRICSTLLHQQRRDHYDHWKTMLPRKAGQAAKRKTESANPVTVAVPGSGRVCRSILHQIEQFHLVVSDCVDLVFILAVKHVGLIHMTQPSLYPYLLDIRKHKLGHTEVTKNSLLLRLCSL